MTTTPEPRTPHGTRSRYVGQGCRCEECRKANAADRRARRVRRPMVAVESVVEHVCSLQAAGASRARIAEAARVSEATLDRIVRQPGTRMRGDLARRVLAVRVKSEVAL